MLERKDSNKDCYEALSSCVAGDNPACCCDLRSEFGLILLYG